MNTTGFELAQHLQTRRIYPEMSTLQHVLFLVTPAAMWRDIHTLHEVLQSAIQNLTRSPRRHAPAPPPMPGMALIPRVAKFSPKRASPIGAAAGHISG